MILGISSITIFLSLLISFLAVSTKIKENEDYSLNITYEVKNLNILWLSITTIAHIALVMYFAEINFMTVPLVSVLYLISIFDYRFKLVPDKWIVIIILVGVLNLVLDYSHERLIINTSVAIVTFIIFYGIAYITNGGFGGADIKLFSALGFIFGLKYTVLIIVLTFVVGSLFVAIRYTFTKDKEVALIPYITIATYITIPYGEEIIAWYLGGGLTNLI